MKESRSEIYASTAIYANDAKATKSNYAAMFVIEIVSSPIAKGSTTQQAKCARRFDSVVLDHRS